MISRFFFGASVVNVKLFLYMNDGAGKNEYPYYHYCYIMLKHIVIQNTVLKHTVVTYANVTLSKSAKSRR